MQVWVSGCADVGQPTTSATTYGTIVFPFATEQSPLDVPVVVGSAVGVTVLIAVVIVVIMVLLKKKTAARKVEYQMTRTNTYGTDVVGTRVN